VSGLFLILAIGEYIVDAGSFDLLDPLTMMLWLIAGLILAISLPRRMRSARCLFGIGIGLELGQLAASLFAALFYGEQPSFPWQESTTDLLIRAIYLVGVVEMLVGLEASIQIVGRTNGAGALETGYDNEVGSEPLWGLYAFLAQASTHLRRSTAIAVSSLRFARYKIAHPSASFADFYVDHVTRHLDHGVGHPSLGKLYRPNDGRYRRGRVRFDFLLELGLKPEHVCVDYGCGSLRLGQFLISYLDTGHYWGLDVTDRFYRDGLDLVPHSVAETKKPNLRITSEESLTQAASASPDFIVCYAVLQHVPPSEMEIFFTRLMSPMNESTVLAISFYEAATDARRGATGWAQAAATVERLIRERRPRVQIRFHRKATKRKGVRKWKTIAEVRAVPESLDSR
jgi:hypothetical protein